MKNNGESSTKTDLIHLFVSLPTNDVCSLRDISTEVLVHQLKSKIELRVGIPGDLIHLFFMNNELADDKTLQEYKLKHGCILRVRLHKTWLGLFLACSKGDTYEVFQNGVQGMSSESSNDFDVELWNKLVIKRATFALFMATYHGYLSLMLELLNSSAADINGCTVFGRTSLHIAAFQGFVGCVSLLLSEGAECSVLDVFGKTPLQLAYVNRHIYCQKRLYMHQTSRNEDEGSYGKASDRRKRPKTAPKPHEIIKNLKQNQRTKKYMSFDAMEGGFKEKSDNRLPSITVPSNDSSLHPFPSYDLPMINIMEQTKTYSENETSSTQYSTPIMLARTAPTRREDSGKSAQSSAMRGIRGIDAILRTSQDDVVGEYHNVDESVADINLTTLKLSLPKEENMAKDIEAKQREVNTAFSQYSVDTRVQSPPFKKMLGFVLKAEENRNLSQERQRNGYSEMGQQEDETWTPVTNGEPDTFAINGNHEPEQQDDRMWTPAAYDNVLESSRSSLTHRKVAPSLSYDEWLEKKRESGKEARNERPASASDLVRSKIGREMDVAAFQKWLEGKKKFRRRSKSEITPEHHRASSGVSFEAWLRQKRQLGESYKAMSDFHAPGKADQRHKATNLGGKSFSEWLAEKRKPHQTDECAVNTKQKRNRSRSGKTFREWLRDKNKEKQKEVDLQENLATLELEKKGLAKEQRRCNPRVKTFEQWFEEKRSQSVIELIQSKNIPVESELFMSKTKFPEDACLVFDMWLMSKNAEELRKEEKLYEEMVEKWRRKEQERLQVRRSILSRLSQAKNDK